MIVTMQDLMSTGTSSTFAKVALILLLTTPYFAKSLRFASNFRNVVSRIAFWFEEVNRNFYEKKTETLKLTWLCELVSE